MRRASGTVKTRRDFDFGRRRIVVGWRVWQQGDGAMKKSTRALVGMVGLDLIVIIGAWWMVEQTRSGAWNAPDPAASISMITTTAGMIVGVVTAVLLLAFVMHRRAGN
jgi:hypothetical protein